MTLTPLAAHSPSAVREALVRRGMDDGRAAAAARGLHPVAVVFDQIDVTERDQMARAAGPCGVACLTGDGWVLLAGGAAQLAGLVRPGAAVFPSRLAGELADVLRGVVESPRVWETARGPIPLEQPVIVGILNVTPDSFSDGGRFMDPGGAVAHAETLVAHGAGVLDVGAESTRPGRPLPVPEAEEWSRLAPILAELERRLPHTPVSVDTVKSGIARRALDAGAWAINDVSALRLDPAIADACAARGAGLILMHSRGAVSDMATYDHADYHDATGEVMAELRGSVAVAETRGVERARIVVDPGLGFAKRPEHNLELLESLPALASLGFPVMVGPSRKRFLGVITGKPVEERDAATAAACVAAWLLGAALFRVHAVPAVREALDVARAVRSH